MGNLWRNLYDLMKYPVNLAIYFSSLAGICSTMLVLTTVISVSSAEANPALFVIKENTIPPPFSAQYDIHMGSMQLGQLNIDLHKNSNSAWVYRAKTKAQGLASLFIGGKDMTETSHLELIDNTIRPVFFERIQITNSSDKSERAIFEWHNNTVKTNYKDRRLQHTLNKYSLDKFTLQLALMCNLQTLPQHSTVAVISKAKLKEYAIIRHGVESIDTVYGLREAVLIERQRGDASYMIWADKERYGVPLKIQHVKKGKAQYEVILAASSLF